MNIYQFSHFYSQFIGWEGFGAYVTLIFKENSKVIVTTNLKGYMTYTSIFRVIVSKFYHLLIRAVPSRSTSNLQSNYNMLLLYNLVISSSHLSESRIW